MACWILQAFPTNDTQLLQLLSLNLQLSLRTALWRCARWGGIHGTLQGMDPEAPKMSWLAVLWCGWVRKKMPTMRGTWDLGHLYLLVSQFAGDPKMIESMVLTIPKAKDCVLWTICLKPPSNCQMYLTHVPSDGCIKTKKHTCIDRPCCCQWFEAPNSRCPLNRITRKGMGH